jgi:hypothetical protein
MTCGCTCLIISLLSILIEACFWTECCFVAAVVWADVCASCCACRNIVRLRGVGATDLTDLVSMRGSMYVVQVSRACVGVGGGMWVFQLCVCLHQCFSTRQQCKCVPSCLHVGWLSCLFWTAVPSPALTSTLHTHLLSHTLCSPPPTHTHTPKNTLRSSWQEVTSRH